MHSFTSNSESVTVAELTVDPPAKIDRTQVFCLLLALAVALAVLEIGTTWWSHSISKFGRRMDSEYADALQLRSSAEQGQKSVLIVGNSTLRLGIDVHDLKQDVAPAINVHVFSMEQTTYEDWYLGLEYLFRRGARPDFVLLLLPPGQMSPMVAPTDDAAHYFVGLDEIMEVKQRDHLTLTGWSNVFFAHFSSFFARRNSLRLGIKRKMFPGFETLASRYMTRKMKPDFGRLPHRFQELNSLCAQYKVQLLYAIPPTNQEDDTLASVGGRVVAPYVPVPIRRLGAGAGRHEPWMLIRGVIDDQIEHDADAAFASLPGQVGEVTERPQPRIDAVVIADVIAVVGPGLGWIGLSHTQVTPSRDK